jgi:hypothetical protein
VTDAEIDALLAASKARVKRNTSRYDYSVRLTIAAKTGLRLGECFGLDFTTANSSKPAESSTSGVSGHA